MPNGTFVVFKHKFVPGLKLYAELEPAGTDSRGISGPGAGVGSVVGFRWHTPGLEMRQAHVNPIIGYPILSGADIARRNAYRDMWYCVAFKAGFFWARYDWLELA
jgi:hypothetical protein